MAQQPTAQCPCHPAWASAWTTSGAEFPSWMLCLSVGSWSAPWTALGLCALPSASLGVVQYSSRNLWAPNLRGKSPLGALPNWTDPLRCLLQAGPPKPPGIMLFLQQLLSQTLLPVALPIPLSVSSQGFLLPRGSPLLTSLDVPRSYTHQAFAPCPPLGILSKSRRDPFFPTPVLCP